MRRINIIMKLMIISLTGLISMSTLMSAPAALAAPACTQQTPKLSFSTRTANTKYIRSKTSGDLKQMHGGGGNAAVGGLGGGEIGFRMQTNFEIVESGGSACVRMKEVAVQFYAYPSIHVASNFPRASCEYNAVMNHEKKHVATLRQFIREYAPKTESAVKQLLSAMDTAIGPISPAQSAQAQQKLQSDLYGYLQTYQSRIIPVLSRRQQAIDSPSEYARVTALCSGWNQRLGGAQ